MSDGSDGEAIGASIRGGGQEGKEFSTLADSWGWEMNGRCLNLRGGVGDRRGGGEVSVSLISPSSRI